MMITGNNIYIQER